MESLMTLGTPQNYPVLMDILTYLGPNDFYKQLVNEKLLNINSSLESLFVPQNSFQTLLYLNHSNSLFYLYKINTCLGSC